MKSLSTFLTLFLLYSLISTAGNGQTSNITGKVVDKNTLKPLPGVNVSLENNQLGIGTITNQQGEFRLWNLPIDTSNILISLDGYESSLVEVKSLKSSHPDLKLILLDTKSRNSNKDHLASKHKSPFLKKKTLSRK